MRTFWRWLLRIVLVLAVIVAAGAFFFRQQISEYYAAFEYAGIFEPDVIDQNFRSLYTKYASVKVPRSAAPSDLATDERPLPESFAFRGETRSTADWIERTQTTGLLVLKDGVVVHEEYRRGNTADTQSIAMSLSKSTVSFLVGNAVADGLVDIEQPVDRYAPLLAEGGYKGVRVKDVLQMSSGIGFNEDYGDLTSDIVRYIIQILTGSVNDFTAHLQNADPPGTLNRYVSADTQVLGMVIEGATKKPLAEYFGERLWSRLGSQADAYWLIDQTGEAIAAGGLNAVLRDYARFGQLYLDEGRNAAGEQIVPADWVRASITPDGAHVQPGRETVNGLPVLGYGYQWWIPGARSGNDFLGIGIYGQFIYVNPARRVVIAKTSAYADYNNTGIEMEDESIAAFQAIANGM
ncbi:MAG: serine hydrolase [Rhizobiaceae bacterium]|nr:serine hydrolase [Rhizobiaceae bacterium]